MSDGGFAAFADDDPMRTKNILFPIDSISKENMSDDEKKKFDEFFAEFKILMEYGHYEDVIIHVENSKEIVEESGRLVLISYANQMLDKLDESIKNCDDAIAISENERYKGSAFISKAHSFFLRFKKKSEKLTVGKNEKNIELVKMIKEDLTKGFECTLKGEEILGVSALTCYFKTRLLYFSSGVFLGSKLDAEKYINQGISLCEDDAEKTLLLRMKAVVHARLGDEQVGEGDKESRLQHKEEADRCMEKVKELEKSGANPWSAGSKARNKEKENE